MGWRSSSVAEKHHRKFQDCLQTGLASSIRSHQCLIYSAAPHFGLCEIKRLLLNAVELTEHSCELCKSASEFRQGQKCNTRASIMTFLTKPTEKTKESYKVLYLPNSDEPQSRRKTDRCFLIAFVISIALLLPLIIYTLCYSDINRLKGCDHCGNICGQKNAKYDQWDCTGQDMTLKPIVAYDRTCLEDRVDK